MTASRAPGRDYHRWLLLLAVKSASPQSLAGHFTIREALVAKVGTNFALQAKCIEEEQFPCAQRANIAGSLISSLRHTVQFKLKIAHFGLSKQIAAVPATN